MSTNNEQIARISKALGDPIRLHILQIIRAGYSELNMTPPTTCCSGGVCVCDIQDQLNMTQSKVSYHLKELKNAHLISETKSGKWNFYKLNQTTFKEYLEKVNLLYKETPSLQDKD